MAKAQALRGGTAAQKVKQPPESTGEAPVRLQHPWASARTWETQEKLSLIQSLK